jgi:glycosyltransferase involved in cell wall biosynthesis
MDQPLISICIPAYKADRYLAETLASVRTQTYRNWELIVTEDGAKDSTEDIVKAFATNVTQSVRYTRHVVNRGLPATRNTGIAIATGDVIALLDADDLWTPEHLETSLSTIANPRSSVAAFASCKIFEHTTRATLGRRTLAANDVDCIPAALHAGRLIVQPSGVVLTRTALNQTGAFDEAMPICNDIDYWIRLCRAKVPLRFTGCETLHYRKHPHAMSRKSADLSNDLAQVHIKHRNWSEIPATTRRKKLRQLLLASARMDARARPGRALRSMLQALAIPLFIS